MPFSSPDVDPHDMDPHDMDQHLIDPCDMNAPEMDPSDLADDGLAYEQDPYRSIDDRGILHARTAR